MKQQIKKLHSQMECEIYGFIKTKREQKTILFIVLEDATGQVQITIEKEKMPEIHSTISSLLKDSVIRVKGQVISAPRVKLGQIEVIPFQVEIISEAKDLPIHLESARDLKMDYRWIELREQKIRLIFEIRTYAEHIMRKFFVEKYFIEIHSPKITAQSSEGGAEVFAIKYYGQKAYLTQSPQFYKQMAMASGFERVFEIGPYYRAEKSYTSRHTQKAFA